MGGHSWAYNTLEYLDSPLDGDTLNPTLKALYDLVEVFQAPAVLGPPKLLAPLTLAHLALLLKS